MQCWATRWPMIRWMPYCPWCQQLCTNIWLHIRAITARRQQVSCSRMKVDRFYWVLTGELCSAGFKCQQHCFGRIGNGIGDNNQLWCISSAEYIGDQASDYQIQRNAAGVKRGHIWSTAKWFCDNCHTGEIVHLQNELITSFIWYSIAFFRCIRASITYVIWLLAWPRHVTFPSHCWSSHMTITTMTSMIWCSRSIFAKCYRSSIRIRCKPIHMSIPAWIPMTVLGILRKSSEFI